MKQDWLEKYAAWSEANTKIPLEYYERYNVKRGLRNADGTGVLVGLTEIGDVHGYIIDEKEKIPVDGRLRYRGIEINDLVHGFQTEKRFGFEETVYLLLFGFLPTADELAAFATLIGEARMLPENFTEDTILTSPSQDVMNKMARSVLVSYSYDERAEDYSLPNILRQCIYLVAQLPVFAAYGYQARRHYYHNESLYIHNPSAELSTAENILQMIRPDQSYTSLEADLLDLALVLHAEHGGGNNSAFTVHVVSSAETDTYSTMAAAIGSLKGAKHGGANIKVMGMMEDIKANVKDWSSESEVRSYLEKILRREAFDKSGLIYGIGHAVYTLSDPRAKLLKERAEILALEKGFGEEYRLYELIEKLTPVVFQEVKGSDKIVAPNVDFYSGFVYSMLNIPFGLYTPLFASSRIAGWSAHRLEEIISGGRIIRPAYKSIVKPSQYIPLSER
jgi:2-methylcitrate synthase